MLKSSFYTKIDDMMISIKNLQTDFFSLIRRFFKYIRNTDEVVLFFDFSLPFLSTNPSVECANDISFRNLSIQKNQLGIEKRWETELMMRRGYNPCNWSEYESNLSSISSSVY